MQLNDPLGDMLTRIRNAQMRKRPKVVSPASKLRARVLDVLIDEGYIRGYSEVETDGHPELGTDVYKNADSWSHRAPFEPRGALAFVPSDVTWHGFEQREIPVVRKSLIVNYVTEDWRAREQLAYPDTPVSGRV